MIVTSMLLVIVGAVTLVVGIFTDQLQLVWISIGACLLAGLFLIVGIVRGRPSRKPVLAGGGDQASWSGAASAWSAGDERALEREEAPVSPVGFEVIPADEDEVEPSSTAPAETLADEEDIVVVPKRTAGSRPGRPRKKAAKKTAGKKTAKKTAKKAAGKKTAKKTAKKITKRSR